MNEYVLNVVQMMYGFGLKYCKNNVTRKDDLVCLYVELKNIINNK